MAAGKHLALVNPYGEKIGYSWSSWQEMDEKKKWLKEVKHMKEEYMKDLMETFFPNLDLY